MGVQDVQPPTRGDRVDRRQNGGIVGGVQRQGLGLASVGPDLFGHGARAGCVQVGDSDTRPLAGQRQRPGPPDPRSCAGQKRDASLKQHHRAPAFGPRRRMTCAATSSRSETASTMVPMALISGVTPRRIDEKT